ncbi:hypothetical protein HGM15179_003393, partial [Zosterops borbonicus]
MSEYGKYISERDKDGLEGRNDISGCYLKIAFMVACCDSACWLGLWVAEGIQQVEVLEFCVAEPMDMPVELRLQCSSPGKAGSGALVGFQRWKDWQSSA